MKRKKERTMKDERSPITFDHFSVSVSGEQILEDITISFVKGINVLYGPRGSGKSTLLRAVVKLNDEILEDVTEGGTVYLFGQDVRELDDTYVRKKALYLDTSFIDAMNRYSFEEFLGLSLKKKVDLEKISERLDDLGILKMLTLGRKTPPFCFFACRKDFPPLFHTGAEAT